MKTWKWFTVPDLSFSMPICLIKPIISHVSPSESIIPESRLLNSSESDNQSFAKFSCKGISSTNGTLETLEQIFENVPGLAV